MTTFEQFVDGLSRLGGTVEADPSERERINSFVGSLNSLGQLSSYDQLADLVSERPDFIPLLALSVRLSQEQLKNFLRHKLGTASWNRLARTSARVVIEELDSEFDLLRSLDEQMDRHWSFEDILVERDAPRLRAAGSIQRGKSLEDAVENVVSTLGLPKEMRTRFRGLSGQEAPCDLAIPNGGTAAAIVCGIKGFDSTGSKLTDAAREVEEMAAIRLPSQFVFAVVDGIGWLSRQNDLRRIFSLYELRSIDGLYTMTSLNSFREDLSAAANRIGLLDSR